MVNLFSKYIKTEQSDFLLDIQNILYNDNFILSTPYSFSVTNELKLICLKAVNYIKYKNERIKYLIPFFLISKDDIFSENKSI
jgi:TRAP-type mannitol/chloroaromatic compound transport system permease small subunit